MTQSDVTIILSSWLHNMMLLLALSSWSGWNPYPAEAEGFFFFKNKGKKTDKLGEVMEAAGYRWHHWAKWECWWQTVAGVTVAPACFQQVIGPKDVSVWTTEKDSTTDSEITFFFVTCIETECLQMLANKQTKCAARTQRSLKGTQLADILPASCRFTHWRPSAHRGPAGQSTNLLTEPRHWHLSFFLFSLVTWGVRHGVE